MRADNVIIMKNDAMFSVVSSDFVNDFWQSNCCIPFNMHCSSILWRNGSNMSSTTEETSDYFPRSASKTNTFWVIPCILKHPNGRLLLSFRFLRIYPSFVTMHTDFAVHRSKFLIISLHKLTRFFSWASVKLCEIHRKQSFFTHKFSCKIKCTAVLDVPKNLYLTLSCMLIFFNHVTHSFDDFWTTNFGWPSRN